MARTSFYPPCPRDVPPDLARPTRAYRLRIVLVLLAVGLFFALYFGLLVGAGVGAVWALVADLEVKNAAMARLLGAVPLGLLCIFLAKNLFLRFGTDKSSQLEIRADEHPRLFDFIGRVGAEVGVPSPRRVFLGFDVNAAALQDVSFYRLLVPGRKSLLIGLGLVNCINLTEFKALLAHEFGHFSQKGMRLSAYAGTALAIIEKIVFGRDFFDRFIERWCSLDLRISFPAWIFYGILWMLRRLLSGFHKALFYFDRARSRQAEFNADLVAVRAAGSDAAVHLLYKSAFGERCMQQAVADLQMAREHHLYTSDLFYHQTHAAGVLRRREKQPRLGEPPPLSASVFEPAEREAAPLAATHPTNHEREENAKRHYVRSTFDERSPWLLFDDVEELRARLTYKFYRATLQMPKDTVRAAPEEIQAFIDEECAESSYDAKYHGLYDCRNLMLGDVYELARRAQKLPWSPTELADAHQNLFDAALKQDTQRHYARLKDYNLLQAVVNGWHKPKNGALEFRGEIYEPADASRLLKKVAKELERDFVWLEDFDQRVFTNYFQMALHLGQGSAEDLFKRYRFHVQLQKIWQELRAREDATESTLVKLANLGHHQRVAPRVFQETFEVFRDAHQALRACLRDSAEMAIPSLKNLPAGRPLREFLLEKPLVQGLNRYERSIKDHWLSKFRAQLQEVKQKTDRIHYKSLGGILALQETVGATCLLNWGIVSEVPRF
jgi:Zn-dependent protease with chaperone function